MPAVTRTWSVVYGSRTIGGATELLLDSGPDHSRPIRITQSYPDLSVEFGFILTAASGVDMASQIDAVEADLRKPDQRLRLLSGSNTFLDFNPSDNTGFNIRAEISKAGDKPEMDTNISRAYSVRITGNLPADLSGRNGRQTST